jgi:hypothetical protein
MADLSWPLFKEDGYGIRNKPICWNLEKERIEIAKDRKGSVVKFFRGNEDWTLITSAFTSEGEGEGFLKFSIQLIPTQHFLGEDDNFFFINEDSVRRLCGADVVSLADINGYKIPKVYGSSFSLKEENGSWCVVKDT